MERFLFFKSTELDGAVTVSIPYDCPRITEEERADLQWLVEYGSRWHSEPATSRRAHCESVAAGISDKLGRGLLTSDQAPEEAEVELSDALAAIAVDRTSDLAPWELLNLGCGPAGLVARSMARIPQNAAALHERPPKAGPLRVLLITARPYAARDVPYLAVAQHLRSLIHAHPGGIDLRIVRPPTFDKFASAISDDDAVDVVHFDGHGDVRNGTPILAFETDNDGPLFIPANKFVAAIRASAPRLIVLNACRSAQSPDASQRQGAEIDPSLAYQIAVETGVPVVAMRYVVRADTAGRFVGALYKHLLAAEPIGKAVQAARRVLFDAPIPESGKHAPLHWAIEGNVEWLLPVLYLPGPDRPILEASSALASAGQPAEIALHGLDDVFLELEKATDSGVLPVLLGPIGADKIRLATAFAKWRCLTRDGNVRSPNVTTLQLDASGLSEPDRLLEAHERESRGRILKLEPAAGAPALIGSVGLSNALAKVREKRPGDIIIVDGNLGQPPSPEAGIVWLEIRGIDDDAMIEHVRDHTQDISQDDVRQLLDASVGNPAFARALASGSTPTAQSYFAQAGDILEAVGLRPTTRAALAQFRRVLNIVTLRHMLHALGQLEGDGYAYLDPGVDESSAERRELEALRARGLLTVLSPNCYVLSPWLSSVLAKDNLAARTTLDSATPLAFARALSQVAEEYNSDYFLRGNGGAAYLVGLEGDNIDHAWRILDNVGEYDRQLSLFSARLALWTSGGHFERIEQEAQALEPLLETDERRDSLLMMRVQAANVMGKLPALVEAIQAVADRYTEDWVAAGSPRGKASEGLDAAYLNMLTVKQNLAATFRVIGRKDEHERLCAELLDEYARAEYGNGTIKAVLSLSKALVSDPDAAQATEIKDLFMRNFHLIADGDSILQSEVYHNIAMLNASAAMGQADHSTIRNALEESIGWLQTALNLLTPPEGANHYNIHRDLAQLLARHGNPEDMDTHAMSAIEGYANEGQADRAAVTAAYAAQGWLWAGRRDRAVSYVKTAERYLAQSPPTQTAQTAQQLLVSLE